MKTIIFVLGLLCVFPSFGNAEKTTTKKSPSFSQTTLMDGYCSYCKNTGKVTRNLACTQCNGRKIITITCKSCNGTGIGKPTVCESCHGSGRIGKDICYYCNGRGKTTEGCFDCSGRGKENFTCSMCNGAGRLSTERICPVCKGNPNN